MGGQGGLDDLLDDSLPEGLDGDVGAVLGGDDHGIQPLDLTVLAVLD